MPVSGAQIICATTGGLPFSKVIRPNSAGKCPGTTQPCSSKTSPDNTVCYEQSDLAFNCPITSIEVIPSSSTAKLSSYNANPDWTLSSGLGNSVIAYSKNADSLPLTGNKLATNPCMSPS